MSNLGSSRTLGPAFRALRDAGPLAAVGTSRQWHGADLHRAPGGRGYDAGVSDVIGREIVTPTPAIYRLWLVWVGAAPGPLDAFATFARERYAPALVAAP
jgi:hypothetical protein